MVKKIYLKEIDSNLVNRLKVEFHKYKNVGHGFVLGIGTSVENWIDSL